MASNLIYKAGNTARDKAIAAAKTAAKTSLETTKAMGQDVMKQTVGIDQGQDVQQEDNSLKNIDALKMQDQEYRAKRYQELKAELDSALIDAQQKRLQRERDWQQTQTQIMETQNPMTQPIQVDAKKPKGPFGGMKGAVKSMYQRVTSKERKGSGAG